MPLVTDTPHQELTYKIIGLAMEVHNELGPGHREADYQGALAIKFKEAELNFEDEPDLVITHISNALRPRPRGRPRGRGL